MRLAIGPLLAFVVVSLLLAPCVAQADLSAKSCCLVISGNPGFLRAHADKLHVLLDLLPEELHLSLLVAGDDTAVQMPRPLTRDWRAQLHVYLEQVQSGELNDWTHTLGAVMERMGAHLSDQRFVIVLREQKEWQEQWGLIEQQATEKRCLVLDLQLELEGLSITTDYLGSVGHDLLSFLGVSTTPLTLQTAMPEKNCTFTVGQETDSVIMCWNEQDHKQIELRTSMGMKVDLGAEDWQQRLFRGNGYVCLHIKRDYFPLLADWEGEWSVYLPGLADIGIWVVKNSGWQVTTQETSGGRLLVVALPASMQVLAAEEQTRPVVLLQTNAGRVSFLLNDLGINGDRQAADGIYSLLLPSFVASGPAWLEVNNIDSARLAINLPSPSNKYGDQYDSTCRPMLAGLSCLIGTIGLFCCRKPVQAVWRISYDSEDGSCSSVIGQQVVLARVENGYRVQKAEATCAFLRLKPVGEKLRLDILSAREAVTVNGERVFLAKQLHHNDQIQLAGMNLRVEKLDRLRAGRYWA